jgi:ERCC4-type nuclease
MGAADAEATLKRAEPPPATVVADVHEPLDLVEAVRERGVPIERRRLAPADFVVGPLAIERKSVGDFHRSMVQKRLFEQVTRLKETYPTAALLLEGDLSFFEELASPRAAWGALLAIAIDLDVRVLPTPSREASAELLAVLARRVGRGGSGRTDVRFKPRLLGPHAEQKFVAQGLPGVGDVTSESLLARFGTLRRLFAASERELLRVPGVGETRAEAITELLDRRFEGRQRALED